MGSDFPGWGGGGGDFPEGNFTRSNLDIKPRGIRDYDEQTKSTFTCNREETSSWDEIRSGMKKILFTREFHPGMKRVEFHPGMKFNLKENLPLSRKTYNKTYDFSLIC